MILFLRFLVENTWLLTSAATAFSVNCFIVCVILRSPNFGFAAFLLVAFLYRLPKCLLFVFKLLAFPRAAGDERFKILHFAFICTTAVIYYPKLQRWQIHDRRKVYLWLDVSQLLYFEDSGLGLFPQSNSDSRSASSSACINVAYTCESNVMSNLNNLDGEIRATLKLGLFISFSKDS